LHHWYRLLGAKGQHLCFCYFQTLILKKKGKKEEEKIENHHQQKWSENNVVYIFVFIPIKSGR